jgi:hypothetical protein
MVDGYDTIDVIGEITENINKINKLIWEAISASHIVCLII